MTEPALPGALGHVVSAMLIGSAVGFLLLSTYLAILTWTAGAALQVVLAACAVAAFGWLGYRLTGYRFWWYGPAAIAAFFAGALIFFAVI